MKPLSVAFVMLAALVLLAAEVCARGTGEKDQVLAENKRLGGTVVKFPFSISFDGKGVGDDAMVHLQKLTDLEGIYLRKCKVTDKGLEKLRDLTKLKYLYLGQTSVTDKGLAHLKRLTVLQALSLVGTQVTDQGLVHLKGLTSLRTLEVKDSKVTDAGVAELKKSLPKLVVR